MCVICYQSSPFLSYQIHPSEFIVICPHISLHFTFNLGGGDVKAYFIIVYPNSARNLSLLGIIWFTILLTDVGINS